MTMKRWLQRNKAPPSVERALKQAAAITGTEVETCFECGKAGFVGQMVDLSTQEAPLLLCQGCYAYRQQLRSMAGTHVPTAQYSCLCGWPLESPMHERITR